VKQLSDYRDPLGFIGHRDDHGALEFGDAAQRLGFEYVAVYPQGTLRFLMRAQMLFEGPEPVRHPDNSQWWGRPGTMSWDNLFPILCGMLLSSKQSYGKFMHIYKLLFKRGFFLWNTKKIGQWDDAKKIPDWCGPLPIVGKLKTWPIFFRGLFLYGPMWLATPALVMIVIFDFLTIIDSLWLVLQSLTAPKRTTDDLNHLVFLRTASITLWTPGLWISKLIYKHFRLPAEDEAGNVYVSVYGPQTALDQYFDGDRNPPLNELWRTPIKNL